MSDKNSKKQFKKLYWVAGAVFLIIVSIALSAFNIWFGRDVLGWGWHIPKMVQDCTNEAGAKNCEYLGNLGVLGDFFGGILNPILAFITFCSVLYTIWLQQESIELQRKELKAAREEFAKSAKAQEEQAKIFKLQQFENTFFSLFSQIVSIHSQLLEKNNGQEKSKVEALVGEIVDLKIKPQINLGIFQGKPNFDLVQNIIKKDSEFNQFTLLVYQALKLINEHWKASKDSVIQEKKYSNILRASLNPMVLQLLLFRCYENPDYDSYKGLIERYSLFEHMPFFLGGTSDSMHERWIPCVAKYYNPSAFGKSVYFKQEINRETEWLLRSEKTKARLFASWEQFKQEETEPFQNCYFTKFAIEDYQYGAENLPKINEIKSIDLLIQEIIKSPQTGYGMPEPLRKGLEGLWIRRWGSERRVERLVYAMENNQIFIIAIIWDDYGW